MNRDDIIRMAIKCQLVTTSNRDGIYADALQRFAALVAAAEREALKEERRKDMAEICSLRESEESLREENERLREENERLREELRQSSIDHTRAEVERLREELVEAEAVRERCNERALWLESENERLREALKRIKETKVFLGAIAQEMMETALRRD